MEISSLSTPVTLNTWHKVRISRKDSRGELQLNSDPAISASSPPPMTELNLGGNLFVGGFRDLSQVNPDSGVLRPLDGAVQRIILKNEVLTNLVGLSSENRQLRVYHGAPCQRHRCENGGSCVPHFRTALCACAPGFSGKHCDTVVY
ncbi:pikachurin-like [Eurytemora carolleeae]|uniref:pikachurin-like n=1 Tax=Eurytemora carolleeae TaxID=1294199 RepID=UPI000C7891C9|nr:pikachurin-like [Eurytemora carolleeae]|eukprot:XP_023338254.1 pikachurin-like [Eurytemora affinis]